jgi:hypothetical protein
MLTEMERVLSGEHTSTGALDKVRMIQRAITEVADSLAPNGTAGAPANTA